MREETKIEIIIIVAIVFIAIILWHGMILPNIGNGMNITG